MLKRIFCALLAMLLLTGAALGESLMSFEDYAAALDALADAEWTADGDMRTLELADEATVSVCLEDENVMAVTVEAPKGSIMDAGSAALKALGAMTDEEIAELRAKTPRFFLSIRRAKRGVCFSFFQFFFISACMCTGRLRCIRYTTSHAAFSACAPRHSVRDTAARAAHVPCRRTR